MARPPSPEQRTIFNFNYARKVKTVRSRHFETVTQYQLRGGVITELLYFPGIAELPEEFNV